MTKDKKTYYAVTVQYGGKRWFAVRHNKPRIVYPVEPRCIIKDKRIANELLKFMQNSDFHGVRLETRLV